MEVGETDTALETLTHFADVVLEATQRLDGALPDDDALTQEAHLRATGDRAVEHEATRDGADLRHTEDLAHFGIAGDDLFVLRSQEAHHRPLDVFEQFVDDLVGTDLDTLCFGEFAGLAVGTDVEADERGIGGGRERDVVLGDTTHGTVHERELHGFALQAAQALGDGFERTLHVGLQHQVQRGDLALLDLGEDVFQLHTALHAGVAALVGEALALLASLAHGAGGLFVGGRTELVARMRHRRQAEHLHRGAGARFFHLLAGVVDHGAHTAPGRTGHDRVAHLQRALVDQDGGHGATPGVEVGLEHDALGPTGGVGGEFFELGHRGQLLEQVVDTEALLGRHLDDDRVATPALGHQFVLGQLGHHALRIGVVLVDLVQGHHDRHLGRLGVVDGLDGLRHHTVVGRDHQHHDVGDLGAAGAHLGERLVTRRVEERDLAVAHRHLVGTDVLGDATGLTGDDVGVADAVEQRGLTVVDVAHHGDDGCALHLERLVVVVGVVEHRLEFELFLLAGLDQQQIGADLERVQLHLLVGEGHRGGDHLAVRHEEADDIGRRAVQLRSELLCRDASFDDDRALGNRGQAGRVTAAELRTQRLEVSAAAGTALLARGTALAAGASATRAGARTAGTTTGATTRTTAGATRTTAGTTGTRAEAARTRATRTTGASTGTTRAWATWATGTRATRAAGAGRVAGAGTTSGRRGTCRAGRRRDGTTRGRHRPDTGRRRDGTTRGRHRPRRCGRRPRWACPGSRRCGWRTRPCSGRRGRTRCGRRARRASGRRTLRRQRPSGHPAAAPCIAGRGAGADDAARLVAVAGYRRRGRRRLRSDDRSSRCGYLGRRGRCRLSLLGRCRLGLRRRLVFGGDLDGRGGLHHRRSLSGRFDGGRGSFASGLGLGLGGGLLRRRLLGGRLLGRLGLFGLLGPRQTVALGATTEAVALGLDDRRRLALGLDAHHVAQVEQLRIGHPELFGELVYADLLRWQTRSAFRRHRRSGGRSGGVRFSHVVRGGYE